MANNYREAICKDGKSIQVIFNFCGLQSYNRRISLDQFKTGYNVVRITEGLPCPAFPSFKEFTFTWKGRYYDLRGGNLPIMELTL